MRGQGDCGNAEHVDLDGAHSYIAAVREIWRTPACWPRGILDPREFAVGQRVPAATIGILFSVATYRDYSGASRRDCIDAPGCDASASGKTLLDASGGYRHDAFKAIRQQSSVRECSSTSTEIRLCRPLTGLVRFIASASQHIGVDNDDRFVSNSSVDFEIRAACLCCSCRGEARSGSGTLRMGARRGHGRTVQS